MNDLNNKINNPIIAKTKLTDQLTVGPAKKRRIETFNLLSLAADIVHQIFDKVSTQDLLALGIVSTQCSTFTNHQWKMEKRQKEKFCFNWSGRRKESDSAKDDYILSQALDDYIKKRIQIKSENVEEQVTTIYRRFENWMSRFPAFGAYVCYDLAYSFSNLTFSSLFEEQFEKQTQMHLMSLGENPTSPEGGDFLLQGLYQVINYQNQFDHLSYDENNDQVQAIFQSFEKAIEKKATCASLYAYLLLKDKISIKYLDSLAQKAEKLRDFRASDAIFIENRRFLWSDLPITSSRPSVLAGIALNSDNLPATEKEKLIEKSISLYGEENVPAYVLYQAFFIKTSLEKWLEAEVLIDKAIVAYSNNVPAEVLLHAIPIKLKLNKLLKAENLFNKAKAAYGDKAPDRLSFYANLIKIYKVLQKR